MIYYFHQISSISVGETLYNLAGLLMGLDIFMLPTMNLYLDITIIWQNPVIFELLKWDLEDSRGAGHSHPINRDFILNFSGRACRSVQFRAGEGIGMGEALSALGLHHKSELSTVISRL